VHGRPLAETPAYDLVVDSLVERWSTASLCFVCRPTTPRHLLSAAGCGGSVVRRRAPWAATRGGREAYIEIRPDADGWALELTGPRRFASCFRTFSKRTSGPGGDPGRVTRRPARLVAALECPPPPSSRGPAVLTAAVAAWGISRTCGASAPRSAGARRTAHLPEIGGLRRASGPARQLPAGRVGVTAPACPGVLLDTRAIDVRRCGPSAIRCPLRVSLVRPEEMDSVSAPLCGRPGPRWPSDRNPVTVVSEPVARYDAPPAPRQLLAPSYSTNRRTRPQVMRPLTPLPSAEQM